MPMRERLRQGNILLLVGIFGSLILMAIVSLGFLTRTDASTTTNLLRELHATYLAESIAAQVEVQVNTRPWNQRFWLATYQAAGGTGTPMASLDRTCTAINLSGETLPAAEWDFLGVVKDLTGELRQYRLYLEVTVRGESYSFSWDKRHEQNLLGGLSRDATQVDKVVDSPGPVTSTDTLLESIKEEEVRADPTDRSPREQRDRVLKLRADRRSHRARALLPDAGRSPVDPAQTVRQVQESEQNMKGKGGAN